MLLDYCSSFQECDGRFFSFLSCFEVRPYVPRFDQPLTFDSSTSQFRLLRCGPKVRRPVRPSCRVKRSCCEARWKPQDSWKKERRPRDSVDVGGHLLGPFPTLQLGSVLIDPVGTPHWPRPRPRPPVRPLRGAVLPTGARRTERGGAGNRELQIATGGSPTG